MFPKIPFRPIRNSLYSPKELMAGLDAADYRSFARTPDFKCFAYYVRHGRSAPKDPLSGIYESLHDNSITQATLAFLRGEKRVVAVMGGATTSRAVRKHTRPWPASRVRCRATVFSCRAAAARARWKRRVWAPLWFAKT
jgi:hypothetical protein